MIEKWCRARETASVRVLRRKDKGVTGKIRARNIVKTQATERALR